MEENTQQEIIQNLEVLFGQLATSKDEKLRTIYTLINSQHEYRPLNTPCSTCPNSKWFSEFAELDTKEGVKQETNIKCNCGSLFTTTYQVKIADNGIIPKKFIPVCSGNPSFIPKV